MVVPREELELTETQLWFAERQTTGLLVALWLDQGTAEKVAIASGESAEDLHLTLAYCGGEYEVDELLQARVITALHDVVQYRERLEGKIAGYGRFIGSESSDGKDVFYVTPDLPRLVDLRQSVVDTLFAYGIPVNTAHGYNPHITLSYLDSNAENPSTDIEQLPLVFEYMTIKIGDRRVDIPFWKPEPEIVVSMSETAELPPEALLGSQPARALYFGSFDKEWIPFLPKPGTYNHETYGDMDLTSETYEQMLSNFDNYVYKQDLPIRATHTSPEAGAVGWIKPGGMRIASDGSIEVKPEWNELGKGLVEDDRFRYVSAEFCKVWKNPVTQEKTPNVAIGLALVTRPHFKTDVLNPLSEREALAFAESGDAGEGNQVDDLLNATPPAAPAAPAAPATPVTPETPTTPSTPSAPAAPEIPAVSLADLTQVVLTAEQRQTERQMFADLTTRVELAERRATTAESKLKEIETTRRVDKFTAEVIGRSAENGNPWFGNPKANVEHLVSLAERFGDDSTEVRWAVMQKRNEAQAIKATGIFDPISLGASEDGASASSQIAHLAEQIKQAEPSLTMEQATARAYDQNPELYIRSLKK